MTVFIIIFMCIAMVLAISSVGLVTTDVIMEAKGIDSYEMLRIYIKKIIRRKKSEGEELEVAEPVEEIAAEPVIEEPVIEPIPEPVIEIIEEPVIEVIPEPVIEIIEEPVVEEIAREPVVEEIEILDHVEADEVDELLSDEVAIQNTRERKGAGHGKQGIINVGDLSASFEANDTVTLAALKEKGLLAKSVGRLKVLANGSIDKPLTVKAESYSVQAIKMIELTGGEVIILKD